MENLANLFINSQQENLKLYFESLNELKDAIAEYVDVLDANFINLIPICIEEMLAKESYSPIHFYWVESFEKLIYLADLSSEYQTEFEADEELEQELYQYFLSTEFFNMFHEAQQNKQNVWEVAADIMSLMQNNLLAFYYLQLREWKSIEFNPPLSYLYSPELGDFEKIFFLKGQPYYKPDNEDFLRLKEISETEITVLLKNRKEKKPRVSSAKQKFEIDQFQFIISKELKNQDQLKEIEDKTEYAIETIKEFAPQCFSLLTTFSKNFVFLHEENIVSYSMQNLPQFSYINIFDRDRVDLVDDLIHENGHHMLNTLLINRELIEEDDEKIFFSPWRRSLRPIRGLYHAYCTFFWALFLFSEIYRNEIDISDRYNEEEKEKIYHRIYEEYLFLKACEPLLEKAYKLKKVTKEGYDIFQLFQLFISRHEEVYYEVEKKLLDSKNTKVKELVAETSKTINEMEKYLNL